MSAIRIYSLLLLSTGLALAACQANQDTPTTSAPALPATTPLADPATLVTFQKRYTGTIGKSAVVVTLSKDSTGDLAGSYYYQKQRLPLLLRGRLRGQEAEMEEQDEAGKITGRLKGRLTATGWAGTWTNPRTGAPLPLQLVENNAGSARLTYGEKEVKDCNVQFENRPNDSDNCSYVAIRVPLIEDHDKLNESVRQLLMDDGSGTPHSSGMDIATWMKTRVAAGPIQSDVSVTDVNNEYHLLSLQIDDNTDSGGAHPNHGTQYVNFDLRSDTKIQLRDLLVPGYEQRLHQLGRRLFYEQNADNTMLNDADEFQMNENFLITPKGLQFHFNPYEAAAYAGGDPTVFISYKQLGTLLKPDNPARAFIAGKL